MVSERDIISDPKKPNHDKRIFLNSNIKRWVEAASAEKGALVGSVRVEGMEAPKYSLEHDYTEPVPMQVDPLSGVITITKGDHQWKDAYTLQVRISVKTPRF